MHRICLAFCCLAASPPAHALAQQPGAAAPASPAAPAAAQAPKGDALRAAFVDAAGGSRLAIAAAADQVMAEGSAGRTKFIATVRAIAAVAPKPTPPAAGAPADATAPPATTPPATTHPSTTPPPATKPPEFADETRQCMATAVTGDPDATKAALAKLAEDKKAGAAALSRLDERGKAILERCVASFVRKKVQTNAIYAGQYDDLRVFHPEVSAMLLRWAQDPPKDAFDPEPFRSASLRALRDTLPAAEATEELRTNLRAIASRAQQARNEQQFLTAVCALHQYGDPSMFDRIKTGVATRAAAENPQEKAAATNMLAQLHYQLRQYEEAAAQYKTLVALLEATQPPPQNLPTTIYNTACSLSLAKKADEAVQYLEKALQVGAKDRSLTKAMIDEDHDMDNLRADPRFQKLIEQHFSKAASPHGK